MAKIGNQPGLCWAPSEPLARQRARSGTIETGEAPEPSEMLSGH
jgi:hypothetical protein